VARANPLWKDLVSGVEALAIFQGPDQYVSPSWYPAKREHGRVVPTWNYAVVHARGALRVIDDPAWLRGQLEALTAGQEASLSEPWAISDAPREYTDRLIGAIVGIEMTITTLTGKWKVSQNQPAENQAGVVSGLNDLGSADAREMAELVEAFSPSRPRDRPA
jgi:transcriptional regulator